MTDRLYWLVIDSLTYNEFSKQAPEDKQTQFKCIPLQTVILWYAWFHLEHADWDASIRSQWFWDVLAVYQHSAWLTISFTSQTPRLSLIFDCNTLCSDCKCTGPKAMVGIWNVFFCYCFFFFFCSSSNIWIVRKRHWKYVPFYFAYFCDTV